MPQQQSNPNQTRARLVVAAVVVSRFARAASISIVVTVAAAYAPASLSAQDAKKPRPAATTTPAAQAAKPATAVKVKASETREEKRAASASGITRARRAVDPAAATPAVPPARATPVISTPAAVVDAPAAADSSAVSAPEKDAASKPSAANEEAELERLRAEIKDMKPGAERARLQRALTDALVKLKRNDEALDALRLMIHEDRFDPPFFFNTGNALARLGDASAAEDAYRKAILQRRGNYARALNNLGVILIRQGHWEEAQQTFNAALMQENYAYAEASYNLARLHLLRGEADLAIREWQRTLRLEPTHAEAAAALARAYAEDGDASRGLLVLDTFVARATRSGSGVPREIAEARRELVEAAAGVAAEVSIADAKLGTGDGTNGNRSRANLSNARAGAHAVDRATYDLLQTARARRESGDFEEAVKHYRSVLARSPEGYFPPANLELGTALINLKRHEEAIAALLPLTQKDSSRYPIAYYHLGRLYEGQGQPERAAHNFKRAAELYGDANPQALIDLSRTREKIGDAAGALAAMNSYAAVIARQGSVPAWVAGRQAQLKQKAAGATQSSTAKP